MSNITRVIFIVLFFMIWVYINCYLGEIWDTEKMLWWQTPTFLFSIFGNIIIPFILTANTIDNWEKRKKPNK